MTKSKDAESVANTVCDKTKAKSGRINEENVESRTNAETKDPSTMDIEDVNTEDLTGTESESNPHETMQVELVAEREKYLRLAAEYDNFRKRSAKEREMTYSNARMDVISKLLPVYDNLERALTMECADEAYYKGVKMIMTQLNEVFDDMGVHEISAVGKPFDPNRHNAVMTIEEPELGENIIAEEYQKGFILGDRVIRFSTVVVAN